MGQIFIKACFPIFPWMRTKNIEMLPSFSYIVCGIALRCCDESWSRKCRRVRKRKWRTRLRRRITKTKRRTWERGMM